MNYRERCNNKIAILPVVALAIYKVGPCLGPYHSARKQKIK